MNEGLDGRPLQTEGRRRWGGDRSSPQHRGGPATLPVFEPTTPNPDCISAWTRQMTPHPAKSQLPYCVSDKAEARWRAGPGRTGRDDRPESRLTAQQ